MTEVNFKLGEYTVTGLDYLDVFRREDGILDFRLEELTEFNLDMNENKTEIQGRNGETIGHKKNNKTVSGSGTSGIISMGLMKAQTGGEIKTGEMEIKKSETKEVKGAGTTVITNAVAIGAEGSEIGEIQLFDEKNMCIKKYSQGTTVSEDKFSYDPATKTISLPDDETIKEGMSILYAYTRRVQGVSINDPADKYSEVREMWFHCSGEDSCDTTWSIAIWLPRAEISGEFGFNFGGDQTLHNFSFDALRDRCNKNATKDLLKYFVYREDGIVDGSTGGSTGINTFATDSEVRKVFSD